MARLSAVVLALILCVFGAADAMPLVAGAVLIRQPGAAEHAAAPGSATLRILARAGERVREAGLDSSSGNKAFDAAALSAVKRWCYVPGFTGDSTGPEWLLVRLVYRPEPATRPARLSAR